jgi:peptidoglycan/LPS O-acetylase OafA/YrhL
MGFIPRLESLRGISALTVVAAHVWGQFSDAPSTGWDAAVFGGIKGLSNGTGAVVGFFVISGLLSLPCSRHCISGSESMSPTKVTSGPAT